MSASIHKYSSDSSSSRRWISVILIIVLVVAAGFAGTAFYISMQGPGLAKTASSFTGPTPPPPPHYYCPLDGTEVPNRAAASKRPIVVQVDNAPPARNPAGLSQADIVYESMAEGDVTRFSAIFACHEAEVIGPVRSARLIDLELVPEYSAILANSGASAGVAALLYETSDIPNIDDNAFHDAAYWRVGDRSAPHNLMTSTAGMRNAAAGAGHEITASLKPLTFKEDSPAPVISSISVPYSAIVDVSYSYDPASNSWLRFIGGDEHIDVATGLQLAPKNVVIQFVEGHESNIIEDEGGNYSMEYSLTGTGRALVFLDGQVIEGTWTRPDRSNVTQYVDATGKTIALNRGQTFVQVVPTGFQPAWS